MVATGLVIHCLLSMAQYGLFECEEQQERLPAPAKASKLVQYSISAMLHAQGEMVRKLFASKKSCQTIAALKDGHDEASKSCLIWSEMRGSFRGSKDGSEKPYKDQSLPHNKPQTRT